MKKTVDKENNGKKEKQHVTRVGGWVFGVLNYYRAVLLSFVQCGLFSFVVGHLLEFFGGDPICYPSETIGMPGACGVGMH